MPARGSRKGSRRERHIATAAAAVKAEPLAHGWEKSCYLQNATFKTTSREAKAASSVQPNGCGLLGRRGDDSHQTRYRHYEPAEPDGSCIRRSGSSTWVTIAFEIVPLITLFELSIWLSVLFERRWRAADELAAAET